MFMAAIAGVGRQRGFVTGTTGVPIAAPVVDREDMNLVEAGRQPAIGCMALTTRHPKNTKMKIGFFMTGITGLRCAGKNLV